MIFRILDTETTGFQKPIQPVEVAFFEVPPEREYYLGSQRQIDFTFNQEFYTKLRPSVPIHPEASKVHGLYLRDLLTAPKAETFQYPTVEGKEIVHIGHNIRYDMRVLGISGKFICTKELAKTLAKFKSNKLSEIVRTLWPENPEFLEGVHSATVDCFNVLRFLQYLFQKYDNLNSLHDLIPLCNQTMDKTYEELS